MRSRDGSSVTYIKLDEALTFSKESPKFKPSYLVVEETSMVDVSEKLFAGLIFNGLVDEQPTINNDTIKRQTR